MTRRAFSLIELIGVVAILAILTALVLPRVTSGKRAPEVIQTVSEAKLTQTAVALQTLPSIITAHVAQSGSLAAVKGTPLVFAEVYDDFSRVLLTEGLIDRPLTVTLGTGSVLRLRKVSALTAASPLNAFDGAYDLSGTGQNAVVGAAYVVELVIFGVNEVEARAINDRIDGPGLGRLAGARGDVNGRVIYPPPGVDGRTEVHVYVFSK